VVAVERRGFTLVELLVVMVIIAILMGIFLPSMGAYRQRAMVSKTKALIRQLCMALDNYHEDHATYPSVNGSSDYYGELNRRLYVGLTGDENGDLSKTADEKGISYISPDRSMVSDEGGSPLFVDSWGNALGYWPWPDYHNRTSYNIWSRGPDGETGTGAEMGDDGKDDVNNWR